MIDLHTHTNSSDGEKTPKELIDLAINKKITTLAITDHDTIDSIERAVEYAKNKEILLIPGIEVEAQVEKGQMHILGLFIDYKNEKLKQKLETIKTARDSRNLKFINEFKKLGFEIELEELKAVSEGKIIGKPHFAKVFLRKKYIKEKDEIFQNYFEKTPFKEIPKTIYEPEEIIKTLKEANAIVILAHPQSLKLKNEELKEKIKELKKYGLDGLECYHSKQTKKQMEDFKNIAHEYGLIVTKGSDYHGPNTKPGIELGTGKNNNIVLEESEEKDMVNKLLEISKNRYV